MQRVFPRPLAVTAAALLLAAGAARAQNVTLPPGGANQKASVSQWIGLVEVNVTYNSPDVTGPNGEDRTGQIWGQLVPYGMATLGFGSCGEQCPWRVGANENTTFRVSHDVQIGGKTLSAGTYGLHMIPGESEWTVVFSKNASSWGSFFYDQNEDALRVTVKPEKHDYTHWLNFQFTDRQTDQATVAMQWENLQVPWTVSVPNVNELYVAKVRDELRDSPGFSHLSWSAAANFCVQNNINLEEALAWADKAVNDPFIGQRDFGTLAVLAQAQGANGMADKVTETVMAAAEHPTSTPGAVHNMGRQLIAQGQKELAMRVFQANFDRFEGDWPTHVGMARAYSALGDFDKALEHARLALDQAPADPNRQNVSGLIQTLEQGKDIN